MKNKFNTRIPTLVCYFDDMPNVADVIENALALPMADRSYVACKLIESIDSEELAEKEIADYDRRVATWKADASKSSSSQEVDAKVQAILRS